MSTRQKRMHYRPSLFSLPGLGSAAVALLVTLGAFGSFYPAVCRADSITELMETKQYKKISRRHTGGKELYGKKWLKPGSSFARVFTEDDGGKLLLDWLGVSSTGLTLGSLDTDRPLEYAAATRELLTKDLKKISISAFLPHPKYQDTITLGLIDTFVKYEPPKLKTLFAQSVALQGTTGTSYEHETGACSLVVKGAKGSLIVVETKRLEDMPIILEFAKKLDFVRLAERLES
jgi:hypothetical protein